MPARKRHIDRVLELMYRPESIRNCSLIGHVDHGKTTLSDSLLASSGLLNPNLAGEAHLLDFMDEEQERGITMKSANISLVFAQDGNDYLVNLVDTPGHVDFSGKVTRALRLIDAAIVVVDAVEGVMIQTEHVLRQALESAVRPLLFINKIDRLIGELGLEAREIQERFKNIIGDFNRLLDVHAPPAFKSKWRVGLDDGTVAFGSALDGWGATLSQFLDRCDSFQFIIDRYLLEREGEVNKDTSQLKELLPVDRAIVKMLVEKAPDPVTAQEYRIPVIWEGDVASDLGQAMRRASKTGPAMIFTSKVMVEHNQRIVAGRLFSGTLHSKDELLLLKNGGRERVHSIGIFMGHRILAVEDIPAGNVVAIQGLKGVKSGETLLHSNYEGDAKGSLSFGQISYMMEPVITVSVEPERLVNLQALQEHIELKLIEDPNLRVEISEETGEILLSGIGPLHLEVVTSDIAKLGIPVIMSEPITLFHESVERSAGPMVGESINGLNKVTMRVAPVSKAEARAIEPVKEIPSHAISEHTRRQLESFPECFKEEEVSAIVGILDDHVIIEMPNLNDSSKAPISREEIQLVNGAIETIVKRGPLVQESIRDLKIIIEEITLASKAEDRSIAELIPMIRKALFELMRQAGIILLEPMFESTVFGSVGNIGTITSLISQHGGKVVSMTQEGSTIKIRAIFSVRRSFKLIEAARSATSGRAVFQNVFHGFEKVTGGERNAIYEHLKERKGLI
ncbi:GTP-binding protein [Candidatus Bathyarchaeota archaeon]|nr:GTP-binding protein [Candidatus Bathyarchaeota archaeon]